MIVEIFECFLDPVHNENESLFVIVPEVTRHQPTIHKSVRCVLGTVQIPHSHDGRLEGQFPSFHWSETLAGLEVNYFEGCVRVEFPHCHLGVIWDGLELVVTCEVNCSRGGPSTFRESVSAHDVFHVGQSAHGSIKIFRNSHSTGDDTLEASQVVLLCLRVNSKEEQESRKAKTSDWLWNDKQNVKR